MKTNPIYLFLWIFLMMAQCHSSTAQEYKTIFGNRAKVSGFGSLINEVSFSNSENIGTFYSLGIEGAILLNQRLYIGLFAMSSVAPYDVSKDLALPFDNDLMFVQTGLSTGYKFFPNSPIHITTGLRVGYGHLQQVPDGIWNLGESFLDYDYLPTFILSPHVNVELNLYRWMTLHAGVGYRRAFGESDFGIDPQNDLSQTTLHFGLNFGSFAPRNRVNIH